MFQQPRRNSSSELKSIWQLMIMGITSVVCWDWKVSFAINGSNCVLAARLMDYLSTYQHCNESKYIAEYHQFTKQRYDLDSTQHPTSYTSFFQRDFPDNSSCWQLYLFQPPVYMAMNWSCQEKLLFNHS